MFDIQNLLQDGVGIGGRSWVVIALWLIGLIWGVYLYQGWREANPIRARFMQRTGLGVAICSAVGLVIMALRAFGVPVLSKPIWGYLVFLVTLGFIAYSVYFLTQRLPAVVASTRAVNRRQPVARAGAKTYPAATPGATPTKTDATEPRPVATTGRRDARREKKRKSR